MSGVYDADVIVVFFRVRNDEQLALSRVADRASEVPRQTTRILLPPIYHPSELASINRHANSGTAMATATPMTIPSVGIGALKGVPWAKKAM